MQSESSDLLARVEALETKLKEQQELVDTLMVNLIEAKLNGLATSSAMHGLLEAIGWNPYIEFNVNQAVEHSFEALKMFDPLQEEMDTYELKVAGVRNAIAKSKAFADAVRRSADPD